MGRQVIRKVPRSLSLKNSLALARRIENMIGLSHGSISRSVPHQICDKICEQIYGRSAISSAISSMVTSATRVFASCGFGLRD